LYENAKRQEQQAQYIHVQAGRSYAQAVRSNNEQAQNALEESTISQMLMKITVKLDQQESLNRTILARVTKLEHEARGELSLTDKTCGGILTVLERYVNGRLQKRQELNYS
jgi:hypothetical protein